MQGMQKPLVFISHSSSDKSFATRLAEALRQRNIEIWIDHEQIRYGESILGKIADGLKRCDALLVLVSASFEVSSWCRAEYEPILTREINERRIRVITLRLDDTAVPELLASKRWADLRNGLETSVIDELASDIKGLVYRQEAAAEVLDDAQILDRLLSGIGGVPEEATQEAEPLQSSSPWLTKIGKALLRSRLKSFARMVPLLALLITMAGTPPLPAPPLFRPSVAVLTFQNRSKEPAFDWLSTALPEVASAKLGLTGDVRAVKRSHVALAERDLLLKPRSGVSPWDLKKIRGLLGVDFVLSGAYDRKGANSTIQLDLILYDARDGRIVAQAKRQGPHWLDLMDHSTEDLPVLSLPEKLNLPPHVSLPKERLQGLFPSNPLAAQLYFQGLERYRNFDIPGAAGLFGRSAEIEQHPLVLALLADMYAFLGRTEEAQDAIQRAMRLEVETRKTSRALPERYRREIELIEREVISDQKGLAEKTYSFFQEIFPDDLSYGFVTAEALINARFFETVDKFLKKLRDLPLAENHPGVAITEADALFVQHRYRQAEPIARQAIKKAQELEAVRQEALARLQLASILDSMGCRDEAAEHFQMARAAFDRTGDRINAAQCLVQTALFYEDFNPSQAKYFYEQAIRRFDELGAQRVKEKALLGLKAVLLQAGQLSEADKIAQAAASEDATPYLQQFARFYLEGDLANARRQIVAAKALLDKDKQPDDYAVAFASLGEIELTEGRLNIAEDLFVEALNIHELLYAEATPYDQVFLGRVYMMAGEYSLARQRFDRALQWLKINAENQRCKDDASPDSIAWHEAHLAMAELEILTGNHKASEEPLRKVLEWARRDEFKTVRSRALSLQARRMLKDDRSKAAEEVVRDAVQLASGDFRAVREAQIASALVRAARGEVKPAVKDLYEIAADSARQKHVVYEFESLLRAGEIEVAQLGEGRGRLERLRHQAEKLHFGQIVQRADSALENR